MSQLNHVHDQLDEQWRLLQREWQTAGEEWKDGTRAGFENEIWRDYQSAMPVALRELQQLIDLIERALRDVEEC